MIRYFSMLFVLLTGCNVNINFQDQSSVIPQALTSTVQIFVRRPSMPPEASAAVSPGTASSKLLVRRAGSGIVIHAAPDDGKALVLTARHLLTPLRDQKIFIVSPTRNRQREARLVAVSDEFDLALLEVSGLHLTAVEVKEEARLGNAVWVVGFPWGLRRTVVTGVVSQIEWNESNPDEVPVEGPVMLIDAAVRYGVSGGGVFDSESGALVGIVRGYRSAEVPIPGSDGTPLRLPLAGETTVVPISNILKFMSSLALDDRIRKYEAKESIPVGD